MLRLCQKLFVLIHIDAFNFSLLVYISVFAHVRASAYDAVCATACDRGIGRDCANPLRIYFRASFRASLLLFIAFLFSRFNFMH